MGESLNYSLHTMKFAFPWFIITYLSFQTAGLAQTESKWDLGGSYTYLYQSDFKTPAGSSVHFQEHYLNLHLRHRFARRWKVGGDYILAHFSGGPSIPNPFQLVGACVDYVLIKGERAELNIRGGLSSGALLFRGNEFPMKTWVVNRVIGGSLDIRIRPAFYLQIGYYNHSPLHGPKDKYSIAQPFLGAFVRL